MYFCISWSVTCSRNLFRFRAFWAIKLKTQPFHLSATSQQQVDLWGAITLQLSSDMSTSGWTTASRLRSYPMALPSSSNTVIYLFWKDSGFVWCQHCSSLLVWVGSLEYSCCCCIIPHLQSDHHNPRLCPSLIISVIQTSSYWICHHRAMVDFQPFHCCVRLFPSFLLLLSHQIQVF